MKKKDVVLLLTGCIVPNSSRALVITDAETRKSQYLEAINWYLLNTEYKIVFGENSGTDLSSEIDERYHERIEFLTYMSKPTIPDRGKGYKEMEIIEYCLRNSKWLKVADAIMKGTGRLVLKNVTTVLALTRTKKSFAASWMFPKYVASDSRFFFCSYDFLLRFVGYKEKIGVGSDYLQFEEALGMCIKDGRNTTRYEFPMCSPNIHGIGGGLGVVYDVSRLVYWRR